MFMSRVDFFISNLDPLKSTAPDPEITWLGEFTAVVSDGAWTADLLQGMLTGAVAVAVAFLIFRKQLVADRQLAKEEKMSAAASTVGRLLIQIAHSTREFSNEGLGEILRNRTAPPDSDLVKAVKLEASIYFPSFMKHVAICRIKEREELFSLGRKVIASNDSLENHAMGAALRNSLQPADRDLRLIGKELIQWSGRGDIPDCLGIVESKDPLPLGEQTSGRGRDAASDAWKQNAVRRIEAIAKNKTSRRSATKSALNLG